MGWAFLLGQDTAEMHKTLQRRVHYLHYLSIILLVTEHSDKWRSR